MFRLVLTAFAWLCCLVGYVNAAGNVTGGVYFTTGSENESGYGPLLLYSKPMTPTVLVSSLFRATGLAVDRKGVVYVAEGGTGRILRVTGPDQYTVYGSVPTPIGVALDGCDNLFVASMSTGKIFVFTGPNKFSEYASGLSNPTDVALDAKQQLYVTQLRDDVNTEIIVFSARNTFTTFSTGFPAMRGLSFDSMGNLYAAQAALGGALYKFTGLNRYEPYLTGFEFPVGGFVDDSDRLYIPTVFNIFTAPAISLGSETLQTFASGGFFYPNHVAFPVSFKQHADCAKR